ncbi:MAG: hypothetical protein HGB08_03830 [Candidatus Moranbacteria bacterium]|nr:hypothetical protein [Candidatus Moranbacteria bacterium]
MESKDIKKTEGAQPENGSAFFALVEELLAPLAKRAADILKKRYGLVGDRDAKTLEHIGGDYGITRERVRQIVGDAMRTISKSAVSDNFKKAEEKIIFAIEKNNGIIEEKEAVDILDPDGKKESNAIRFIVECSKRIRTVSQKNLIEKSWAVSDSAFKQAKDVARVAEDILKKGKVPLKGSDLSEKVAAEFPGFSKEQAFSFMKVLARVKKNKFGKWGIYDWNDINPKGSREKINLVLKEEGKPLHFTEIAKSIDKHGLSKKKTHPQTIHNELIKDDNFVLIGRGIYALREWGYYEGTIKDVIRNILAESKEPLQKEKILQSVFKVRKVKKTTVMINLNNPDFFKKEGEYYSLK